MAAPIVAALTARRAQVSCLTHAEAKRLRGVQLIDLLLDRSSELRSRNPRGMVQIAKLALLAAERLDNRKYGALVVADCRARCWAELGNAFRVADDLGSATNAISHAQAWMDRGSGDLYLLGRVADFTASLLSSQRRFDRAATLLWYLADLYRQIGESHLLGRCLISIASVYGIADEPEKGLQPLLEGLELIDPSREKSLLARALNNLICLLADAGRYRRARLLLWRIRGARLLPTDPLDVIRLRLVEGKIFRGLGNLQRAEEAFLDARERFAKVGLVYQTALVSLDLAHLWLQQGHKEKLPSMVAEMISTFRALGIAREAVAALLVVREACARRAEASEEIAYRLHVVAACLKELEWEPAGSKKPSNQ
jgi:tetratricopeptide (TPR) repeat protein